MSGWEESPLRNTCSPPLTLKRIEDFLQCRHLKCIKKMHLSIHVLRFRSPKNTAHPLKPDQEIEHSAQLLEQLCSSTARLPPLNLFCTDIVFLLFVLLFMKKMPNYARSTLPIELSPTTGKDRQNNLTSWSSICLLSYIWKPSANERKPKPCVIMGREKLGRKRRNL